MGEVDNSGDVGIVVEVVYAQLEATNSFIGNEVDAGLTEVVIVEDSQMGLGPASSSLSGDLTVGLSSLILRCRIILRSRLILLGVICRS